MTVPTTSRYLRYLPPILWERGDVPPAFSLGTMLLVFEKLLTGVANDTTAITHGDHQHQAIEEVIANLHQLFDPWKAPAAFLPWLASWLGLELAPTWDVYQRRKAISEITHIYRQRGLESALQQYLSLYTVIETRPRIALDTGGKVLFAQPQPDHFVPIHSLVSQGNFVANNPVSYTYAGLVRPWCLAVAPAPDGSLFIGDRGTAGISAPFTINSQVWHLDATGAYPFAGIPAVPQPIHATGLNLNIIIALTIRTLPSGAWELYVLDSSGTLYRLLPPTFATANVIANVAQSGTFPTFVAMAVDKNNDLLILERGDGTRSIEPTPTLPPTVQPNPPKIITVQMSSSPPTIKRTLFQQVIEPLSLLVLPNHNLVIGDGRKQSTASGANLPAADLPANLVLVDRSDDANWKESLLLAPTNPLVAPTAVVREDDTHLLVLDAGLKSFLPDPNSNTPFIVDTAESAVLYRVDQSQTPSVVTRASETDSMVYPTGMVLSQGRLFICDPGQTDVAATNPNIPYRVHPHEFGVVIHFCKQRFPSDETAQQQLKYQIIADITHIINQEKPAHTLYRIVTES